MKLLAMSHPGCLMSRRLLNIEPWPLVAITLPLTELMLSMVSKSCVVTWACRLKRSGLVSNASVVLLLVDRGAIIRFYWQPDTMHIDIFTDAKWAGCKTGRKSTSGGGAMVGRCCIKSSSKTQSTIAQSYAESELLATVRRATEGIYLISLVQDLGM